MLGFHKNINALRDKIAESDYSSEDDYCVMIKIENLKDLKPSTRYLYFQFEDSQYNTVRITGKTCDYEALFGHTLDDYLYNDEYRYVPIELFSEYTDHLFCSESEVLELP